MKENFLVYFSKKFNLPVTGQNGIKFHFKAQELIESTEIDTALVNFFEEKGYLSKKLTTGGFLFKKEKETIIISVTNFSGGQPFSISVSIEIF